jgi:hypothetical protein
MSKSSKRAILLVCKDAGAANAFSAFVKGWREPGIELRAVCIGYAVGVFRQNGLEPYATFDEDIDREGLGRIIDSLNPVSILIGTSFDSMTERWSSIEARERGITCVAFVDWWSSFGLRFSTPNTNDLSYLPDKIAVIDRDAFSGCVNCGIPKSLLYITGNPYWDHLLREKDDLVNLQDGLRKTTGVNADSILAVIFSSYLSKFNLGLGYDENDFWNAIMPLPYKTRRGASIEWFLKPHPKENRLNVAKALEERSAGIHVTDKINALELGLAADFVIGMCSTSLFECALLGKKLFPFNPGLIKKNPGS